MGRLNVAGEPSARLKAWRWLLAASFVLIAALNFPGHLSVDSVIGLAEGRSGQRITWGPPAYSAILGAFDRVLPGTGLYVSASLLTLLASWAALPALRQRIAWLAPLLLAGAVLTPQVLIYQAIVWKDVLFANLTIAAFVALAHAACRWDGPRRPWGLLGLACLCLAVGCLVRQNGAVAVVPAAMVLAWTARGAGRMRSLAWGVLGLAAPLLLAAALNAVTPVTAPPGKISNGLRMVQNYDLAGAVAADSARPLPDLAGANPQDLAVLRQEAPKVYSPARSDSLGKSGTLGKSLWKLSDDAVGAQWRSLLVTDPVGYAERRLAVFDWVLRTPELAQCLPLHVGQLGPADIVARLQLPSGVEPQDQQLWNYATWWFKTPFYSHLTYAVVAALAAVLMLLRRSPADVAMAGLMAAALGFTASFFVISLACDYRYLYVLDLTAITGVLYLALDPGRGGPARRSPRRTKV